ncbi:DUF4249 domain-containing protein [Mongoliitalea lutea]|uniref:DUF4249 domain-containing protein n=1 Tax=Mongoliitalea lutea TaxID=849756 RepID=A0A8J3CXV6_9BACT|nr:DUF4249 domain-containing protein [Mongoliitalea lutea]GHB32631.1 hypothetical protein GCM10008106_11830 [Mongoliitalea lutea]
MNLDFTEMKVLKQFAFLMLVAVLGFSCSDFFNKEIPISLEDHRSLLVVNSILGEGQEELLFGITTSRSMTDTTSLIITPRDLDIDLILNSDSYLPVSYDSSRNLYYSTYKVQSGDVFELNVKSEAYPEVEAETRVPMPARILDARIGARAFDSNGRPVREIFFTVEDIEGEQNFFFMDLIMTREEWGNISDVSTFESPLRFFRRAEFRESLAFNDTFFENASVELMLWMAEEEFQNMIYNLPDFYVRLYTVDKPMYDYFTQLHVHLRNRNADLFAGEPINVPSNVKGGFGVFGSHSFMDFKLDYQEFLD